MFRVGRRWMCSGTVCCGGRPPAGPAITPGGPISMNGRKAARGKRPMPERGSRRLRILTWHVHGNYLYYLTQVPHDFYLVADAERSTHRTGRSGSLPWGYNVHEVRTEELAN